jgi:hypothetical protein
MPIEKIIGSDLIRDGIVDFPEVSEVEAMRHFTELSHWNYCIDDGIYPLGSCTMKYNPKIANKTAALPGFADTHPLQPVSSVQGNLEICYALEEWLCEIVGMVIRHGEAFGISDRWTVWNNGTAVYRPTVHYAYMPCDGTIASLYELRGRNYELQQRLRIMNDREIIGGADILGALLMGHPYKSWWTGSILTVEESSKLAPGQNATTVQVAYTLPVSGITLEDLRQTTLVTQIERGMTTRELSPIRNHLDRMKGGRISRYFHPAKMIHIISIDPGDYDQRMHQNYWLHNLPDCTTFQEAIASLKRYDAWKAVPEAVRRHLEKAEPEQETVKARDFEKMSWRVMKRSRNSCFPSREKSM